MLVIENTNLIIPPDLFEFLSYWAAIQASQVPSVRREADWMRDNTYFALQVRPAGPPLPQTPHCRRGCRKYDGWWVA